VALCLCSAVLCDLNFLCVLFCGWWFMPQPPEKITHRKGWVERQSVLSLSSSTAIGVDYTVPQSGRLLCSAVVQNIYNYVTFSLSDNWGFSDGEIRFRILLFIRIIRGSQVIAFDRLISRTD